MEDKKDITELQSEALSLTDLPEETIAKVRKKYHELAKQFPTMKRHRLMRKAGEFYKIKFKFE